MVAMALLLAGGAAWASIPDASGVIRGCYPGPGTQARALRVIDTDLGQACAADETALSWSQQGLRGTTGTQGPAGVGTTDAWFSHDLGTLVDITRGVDLRSIDLQPGSYVLDGKSTLFNQDTDHLQGAFCEIKVGATDLDRSDVSLENLDSSNPNADESTVPTQAAATFGSPTTVVLRCSGTGVQASFFALTAMKVGQVQ